MNWSSFREYLPAALMISLFSVGVLVVLFYYLKRHTRRHYFTIWTAAWLFYAVWLVLCLQFGRLALTPWLVMLKEWCVSAAAVFLLWGSTRFLRLRSRQTLFGLFLGFLLVWNYANTARFGNQASAHLPVFFLIGFASLLTSWCFFRLRLSRDYMGAGLLAFGFFLWGLYLMAYPFLESSDVLLGIGMLFSALLQLFIAVSMIILVLEEARAGQDLFRRQISTHKTEKESLRLEALSNEERYRSLFDQAGEGILITNTDDLRILDLNRTAGRWFGLPDRNVSLPALPEICSAPSASMPPPREGAEWFAWAGCQARLDLRLPAGGTLPVEIHGAPVRYRGHPAYQFFVRELTERIRLEQQLRQTEKLSALARMISGVAHELNNPLAAIKGYLELILSRHELERSTRADLEKVSLESSRAARIVNDFLTFSQQQPIRWKCVDINQLVRRALQLRTPELEAAGLEVRLELCPQLPATQADPDQIQQVLVNLVMNAAEAMAGQPAPHRLEVSTSLEAGRIQIVLQDNGTGIPTQSVPHIFEPFFTTKEVGAGMGLGLTIAHGVVVAHQGTLAYQPAPGGGARFVISLPLRDAAPDTDPPPAEPIDATLQPSARVMSQANILVLDDEPAILELLGESLRALGYEPILCGSAPPALQLIERQDFDLVVSDLRMPIMDGRQFYRLAVERKPGLAGKFLFLTGDIVGSDVQDFLRSTQTAHLVKPFRLSEVEKAIMQKLGEAAPRPLSKAVS